MASTVSLVLRVVTAFFRQKPHLYPKNTIPWFEPAIPKILFFYSKTFVGIGKLDFIADELDSGLLLLKKTGFLGQKFTWLDRRRGRAPFAMLLAREFGVWVGETPSAPALARRWPAKHCPRALDRRPVGGSPGGGEDDCRICTATSDMWARLNGGEGRDVIGQSGGFSHESEHDLAVMVCDFLENGSGSAESRYSSDSDSRFSELAHLAEKVLVSRQIL